jgi:hypothetical protein
VVVPVIAVCDVHVSLRSRASAADEARAIIKTSSGFMSAIPDR